MLKPDMMQGQNFKELVLVLQLMQKSAKSIFILMLKCAWVKVVN